MTTNPAPAGWQALDWWLRRNPMYLLSAACMAVGARLYLVDPHTYAGDVGVILLTLGVLQAYEWSVLGILLALHRARRAPEDRAWLLLIAALFWTGPLAATVELTAVDARAGFGCSVGVLLFALLELWVVRRSLSLALSLVGRIAASACFVLLVFAPTQLRVTGEQGTNELFLYACWWALAGVTLLLIAVLRAHAKEPADASAAPLSQPLAGELAFVLVVLAATATHLWGMNYAFTGHAQAFYAAPVLVALSIVAIEALSRLGAARRVLRVMVAAAPVVAIIASTREFAAESTVRMFPAPLDDPLAIALLLAAATWWYAAGRLASAGFFHLGSLGLAGLGAHIGQTLLQAPAASDVALPGAALPSGYAVQDIVAAAAGGVCIYLLAVACVRRSRIEAVAGLLALQVAVIAGVWERTPAAPLIVGIVAGWSALVALHVALRRPPLATVLLVCAGVTGLAWFHDASADMAALGRANSAGLILMLAFFGWLWQRAAYAWLSGGLLAGNGLFFLGRAIAQGPHPVAGGVVAGSFVLLACAALVSWHKDRLLDTVRWPIAVAETESPEVEKHDQPG